MLFGTSWNTLVHVFVLSSLRTLWVLEIARETVCSQRKAEQ